jgi:hypothetical protein
MVEVRLPESWGEAALLVVGTAVWQALTLLKLESLIFVLAGRQGLALLPLEALWVQGAQKAQKACLFSPGLRKPEQ